METNKTPHTPTPWTYEGGDNNSVEINIGQTTASVTRSDKNTGEHVISRDEMQANAEFIVTACNSYEALKQQNEELIEQTTKLQADKDKMAELLVLNYRTIIYDISVMKEHSENPEQDDVLEQAAIYANRIKQTLSECGYNI